MTEELISRKELLMALIFSAIAGILLFLLMRFFG